ncbi:MAG: redoxin family protein [Methylomonas sp.]|nr:redoxin family protein [Methylomonas sp.]
MHYLTKGPALLYFWAEWCGVCRAMHDNVDAVLRDYPGLTVAVRSADTQSLSGHLSENKLDWPVVDDRDGTIGQTYGVRAVPAVFFIDNHGDIVFTSVGYTSEWGLRFWLWLSQLLYSLLA